jgi:hypothetical protein
MDTTSIGSVANLLSFAQATGSAAPTTRAPARGQDCQGEPQCSQKTDDSTATLSYRRTERAGLYIVTQEGDVVRLRIKVSDSVNATASDGTTDGTQVGQVAVDARSSVKISFHVDGNLNASELDAIRNVVEQVGKLADQFFAGDVPAAFAAAQDLNIDGSQLAKVGLRLSARESVTYSGPALVAAVAQAPATAPTPALPASTAPSSPAGTDAPSVATEPVASAPATSTSTSTAEAPTATDAAPTPPPSTDPAPPPAPPAPTSVAGNALAMIGDFLHQLLSALGAPAAPSDGASQPSVSLSLKLRIFAATVAHLTIAAPPAADSSEKKAAPLVGDTLDALAAAHDPPLSTNA